MAATLKHLTQRALKTYTFMDADNPLWQAWSDYEHAKAHALPLRPVAQRLRAELRLETMVSETLEAA